MLSYATKKATGSYYTCGKIADYIAKWAISKADDRVLEPSFGDGIFIDSAISRFYELGNRNPDIIGVELQKEPFYSYIVNQDKISGFLMDFLDFRPEHSASINAIIGNPPYVSLKKIDVEEKNKALELSKSYNVDMQTSGSLWMPFIIHSTELLSKNGRLGFVLPYEITYVRYAFDLWNYLSENYGSITVCRIFNDFFPDVDVETIILLAEKKGNSTKSVKYKVFENISDLYNDNAKTDSEIHISDIVSLEKPFERNLLTESVKKMLDQLRNEKKLLKLVRDCKFKIGYVSGNKDYFHITKADVENYGIRTENIKKCLLNAKQISSNRNIGIETDMAYKYSYLFYPVSIHSGEKEYIRQGEEKGINKAYKCRVRNPWYLTPGLEIPDLILTVFGDVPKLMLNNGNFYVSNSLLSGFTKVSDRKELICRWYNSLTLLSIETNIHSLGGGTLVLIPGETDKLEIIAGFPTDKIESTYKRIADYARCHSTEEIYWYGDKIVLKDIYGFTDKEINEIKESISMLRSWRNPSKRRSI